MRALHSSQAVWYVVFGAIVGCGAPTEDGGGALGASDTPVGSASSDVSATVSSGAGSSPTTSAPTATATTSATNTGPSPNATGIPAPSSSPSDGPEPGGAGGTPNAGDSGEGGTPSVDPAPGDTSGPSGDPPAEGGAPGIEPTPGAGGGETPPDQGGAGAPSGSDEPTFGPDIEGECTDSQTESGNASGSGPHEVVIETNSDAGINEGTIYRPADLGGGEVYPILVWGEGGCSQNGSSNAASMAEIASHGYFVVADGTPGGSGSRSLNSSDVVAMAEPLIAYIDWAIAENSKPCSAYYHALDASKVAANGFSCGGLMSTGTAGDPRITTWGSTSSGTFSEDRALYDSVHTPVLIIEGGQSDVGYENGLRDYENISPLGHPIMFFSKDIGHGGDLFQGGSGDFTQIHLAWLNWWLKGDEGATGKGVLVGDTCSYCSDPEWEVMSANLP